MNVFVDFHHASLLKSFILLFEKRLGGNVYRPIGIEWAEEGFWKVYDHPATQAQYLGIGSATPDGTPPLNEIQGFDLPEPFTEIKIYHCKDIEGNETNKAITFNGFMQTKIDIIIASIPQHIEPFKKLSLLHPSRPKVIYQIGNAWIPEQGVALNIMASAKMQRIEGTHFIEYHQEFDTDIFKPNITVSKGEYFGMNQNIYSFVNVFNGQSHFSADWQLFEQIERIMPDWNFKSYGGQCRDGSCDGSQALADKMREARFIWHTKNGGDGYGHVIHNSAAVGRPLIVKKEYYQGKMAESLIIDGETAIVIDGLDNEQIKNKILYYNDPARYVSMCRAVYENFTKVCNFDEEFIKIKDFLLKLQ